MSDRPAGSWLSRLWHTLFRISPSTAPAAQPTGADGAADGGAQHDDDIAIKNIALPRASADAPAPDADQVDAYRQQCARHLYDRYPDRIYRGQLPPMLYAVAVLEILVDDQGGIVHLNWLRDPADVDEVPALIEALVNAAAPFPAPRMVSDEEAMVSYTDTWLWDESGQFQLHTLSEGQL